MAATLINDSNSAPDKPTVRFAKAGISTSSANRVYSMNHSFISYTDCVFFSNIFSRASRSGKEANYHLIH